MEHQDVSRRDFLKTSTVASAATLTALGTNYAFAQGSDRIKVGLIGCGGRGTGAARDAAQSSANVEICALGDMFKDRLDECKQNLAKNLGEKFKVTDERSFTGFDACKQVIACDVNYIILATPPGFRPMHLRAAINAGKNVFTEKPVGVDGPGIRSVIESSEMAASKGLGLAAGTQRRHQQEYLETIKRIHDGAIGEILTAQVYWNQGGLWHKPRQASWSDMEWQIRNWLYFTWLSGDHIVEQHVHNLDVANWVLKAHPISAMGMGGRQARTGPEYGHIYDHFAIEYEYPNGVRVMSMCRQIDGNENRVTEHVVGSKGTSSPGGSLRVGGQIVFRAERGTNPYVQEHTDLIASIRAGKPINEGKQVAESTLTAIMGRMSAYTGQIVKWEDALNSRLDLMPVRMEMGTLPVPEVAIPGKTKLV